MPSVRKPSAHLSSVSRYGVVEVGHDGLERPGEHLAGGAVDRHRVALAEGAVADDEAARLLVDVERGDAHHRRLAELAGDERGVARASAARGEDAARGQHAVHVVRLGLGPNHDHRLLLVARPSLGGIGVEGQDAGGGARGDIETGRDQVAARLRGLAHRDVELRVQEEVDVVRRHALHGLRARDQALAGEVDGDPHRRLRGALGVARLQDPELAAFDRELDVLRVPVVTLELPAGRRELAPDARHRFGERRDAMGDARAGDHVLALRIGEPVALDLGLAVGDVAGRHHAGRGAFAQVAEHHRLDVHRGAEIVRDPRGVAVVDRALAVPRAEHRLDGQPQLLDRVGREGLAAALAHDLLELLGDRGQVVGGEVGVVRDAAHAAMPGEHLLERLVRQPEHDRAEHLHQAAVGVEGEPAVGREHREACGDRVVHAEVEHRVHHAGHRELGAGTAGDEEGVARIAEALAGLLLDAGERLCQLVPQPRREPVRGQVGVAGFRGHDQAGRHRQSQLRHLGEVRALAAEQRLHRGVALVEQVDPLGARRALRGGAANRELLRRLLQRGTLDGTGHDMPWMVREAVCVGRLYRTRTHHPHGPGAGTPRQLSASMVRLSMTVVNIPTVTDAPRPARRPAGLTCPGSSARRRPRASPSGCSAGDP